MVKHKALGASIVAVGLSASVFAATHHEGAPKPREAVTVSRPSPEQAKHLGGSALGKHNHHKNHGFVEPPIPAAQKRTLDHDHNYIHTVLLPVARHHGLHEVVPEHDQGQNFVNATQEFVISRGGACAVQFSVIGVPGSGKHADSYQIQIDTWGGIANYLDGRRFSQEVMAPDDSLHHIEGAGISKTFQTPSQALDFMDNTMDVRCHIQPGSNPTPTVSPEAPSASPSATPTPIATETAVPLPTAS